VEEDVVGQEKILIKDLTLELKISSKLKNEKEAQ
jgi:hypothetical protein